jgi:hypothetical protein
MLSIYSILLGNVVTVYCIKKILLLYIMYIARTKLAESYLVFLNTHLRQQIILVIGEKTQKRTGFSKHAVIAYNAMANQSIQA